MFCTIFIIIIGCNFQPGHIQRMILYCIYLKISRRDPLSPFCFRPPGATVIPQNMFQDTPLECCSYEADSNRILFE